MSLEGPPLTHCCLSRGQKGWLPGVSISGQMRPVPRSVAAQCREGPKPVKDAPYSCAMAVTPPSITVHPSHHPHCLRGHWQPVPRGCGSRPHPCGAAARCPCHPAGLVSSLRGTGHRWEEEPPPPGSGRALPARSPLSLQHLGRGMGRWLHLKWGSGGKRGPRKTGGRHSWRRPRPGGRASTMPSRRPAHSAEWHPASGWQFLGECTCESRSRAQGRPAGPPGRPLAVLWAVGTWTGHGRPLDSGSWRGSRALPREELGASPSIPSPAHLCGQGASLPAAAGWVRGLRGGCWGASVLPASGRLSLLCSKMGVCPIFTFLERIPSLLCGSSYADSPGSRPAGCCADLPAERPGAGAGLGRGRF